MSLARPKSAILISPWRTSRFSAGHEKLVGEAVHMHKGDTPQKQQLSILGTQRIKGSLSTATMRSQLYALRWSRPLACGLAQVTIHQKPKDTSRAKF